MVDNFDREIIALDNSKYISDKEKIVYVYTEFYKEIISALVFGYNFLVPEFKKYLTLVFEETVEIIEEKKENISCVVFLNTFFNIVSNSNFFKKAYCLPALNVIETYLSKFDPLKDSFGLEIPYVDMLDTINMDFYTKARVMLILVEHFNNFTYNFNSLYCTDSNTPNDREDIIEKVVLLIPEIMSKSDGFYSFKLNLQKKTYDVIDRKFVPAFECDDNRIYNMYVNLDFVDGDILNSLLLVYLSGYKKEIDDNKNSFDKIKYNVKKLSISKKLNNLGYKVC